MENLYRNQKVTELETQMMQLRKENEDWKKQHKQLEKEKKALQKQISEMEKSQEKYKEQNTFLHSLNENLLRNQVRQCGSLGFISLCF